MQTKRFIKVALPRFLNLTLWFNTCAMIGTGLLLAFRLPPGSQGGRGLRAWGIDRHEWGDIHTWLGYVFVVFLLLHLALHWRWLWSVAARKRPWPILAGLGAGLLLALILVFQPVTSSDRGEGFGGPKGRDVESVQP